MSPPRLRSGQGLKGALLGSIALPSKRISRHWVPSGTAEVMFASRDRMGRKGPVEQSRRSRSRNRLPLCDRSLQHRFGGPEVCAGLTSGMLIRLRLQHLAIRALIGLVHSAVACGPTFSPASVVLGCWTNPAVVGV